MMLTVRALVRNGRLVLDEPTDLPEGSEVELAVTAGDDLTDEDRIRLHAALDRSDAQLRAGSWVPGADVVGRLRASR